MARRPPKRVKLSYVLRDSPSGEGDATDAKHWGWVNSVKLSSSGDTLFSAGRDSVVRQWRVSDQTNHVASFKGHTDWVNDIAICENVNCLASVSSDRTLKLWNPSDVSCLASFTEHTDYIKSACYAGGSKSLFTAGLDGQVVMWDLGNSSCAVSKTWDTLHPESIYSLAVTDSGQVIASGSVDKILRLWDPRTDNPFGSFEGHDDVIKAITLNETGTRCITASSDSTVKLWDVGERRCISTYRIHSDSVWTVQANSDFTSVYSGGRDGKIFLTDLLAADPSKASTKLFEESAPVVSLALDATERSVWTSTSTVAAVNRWDLSTGTKDSQPLAVRGASLKGRAALTKHRLLSDGVQVLAKNAEDEVSLWNVVTGRYVQNFGKVDYAEKVKELTKPFYVKKWCSLDTTLGCLSVHLETDCFSAWTSSDTIPGFESGQLEKINIGCVVLQALLRRYQDETLLQRHLKLNPSEDIASDKLQEALHNSAVTSRNSHNFFVMDPDFQVWLTQTTEPQTTLAQFTIGSADDADIVTQLRTDCPEWTQRCLFSDKEPWGDRGAMMKLTINLSPVKNTIAEQKKLPPLPLSTMNTDIVASVGTIMGMIADELNLKGASSVQIYCNDKLVDEGSNMAYVFHVMWRKSGNIQLEYCGKASSRLAQKI